MKYVKDRIYRLRVELHVVEDVVWRIVEVPRNVPLDVLGEVIEAAFGWDDKMGFMFQPKEGPRYANPWMAEDLKDEGYVSYRDATIDELMGTEGDVLPYMYGLWADWRHDAELEDIRDPDPGARYPRCTGGRGACPRAGNGYEGYDWDELYKAFCDEEHEDHEKAVGYIGADYVPEPFDADHANLRIRKVASAVWKVYTIPVPGTDLEAVVCEDAWTGRFKVTPFRRKQIGFCSVCPEKHAVSLLTWPRKHSLGP